MPSRVEREEIMSSDYFSLTLAFSIMKENIWQGIGIYAYNRTMT